MAGRRFRSCSRPRTSGGGGRAGGRGRRPPPGGAGPGVPRGGGREGDPGGRPDTGRGPPGPRAAQPPARTGDRRMKVFDFDPRDYPAASRDDGYVHTREGMSGEFPAALVEYGERELTSHKL